MFRKLWQITIAKCLPPTYILSPHQLLIPMLEEIDRQKGSCTVEDLVSFTNVHPTLLVSMLEWHKEHRFIYYEKCVTFNTTHFRISDYGRSFLRLTGKEVEDNEQSISL